MGEEIMFVTSKKHAEMEFVYRQRIAKEKERYENEIAQLKKELKIKREIEYKLNFPQQPHTIVVSKYVAENYLKNKLTFVPKYPFPDYHYKGLQVRVDESLRDKTVMFEADWVEPPIICQKCGERNDYEFAFPKENPKFCDKYCYENYFKGVRK